MACKLLSASVLRVAEATGTSLSPARPCRHQPGSSVPTIRSDKMLLKTFGLPIYSLDGCGCPGCVRGDGCVDAGAGVGCLLVPKPSPAPTTSAGAELPQPQPSPTVDIQQPQSGGPVHSMPPPGRATAAGDATSASPAGATAGRSAAACPAAAPSRAAAACPAAAPSRAATGRSSHGLQRGHAGPSGGHQGRSASGAASAARPGGGHRGRSASGAAGATRRRGGRQRIHPRAIASAADHDASLGLAAAVHGVAAPAPRAPGRPPDLRLRSPCAWAPSLSAPCCLAAATSRSSRTLGKPPFEKSFADTCSPRCTAPLTAVPASARTGGATVKAPPPASTSPSPGERCSSRRSSASSSSRTVASPPLPPSFPPSP